MKRLYLTLLVAAIFSLGGCNMKNNEQETSSIDNSSTIDDIETEKYMMFPSLNMEVDQKLCIDNFLIENEGSEILLHDKSFLDFINDSLIAKKEGETYFLIKFQDRYQKVEVKISQKGSLNSAFNIADMKRGQKIVAFGDSVTANATINADLTYVRRIADEYGLNFVNNYAIGGTTATYMFPGSNIDKEYHNLDTAPDGVRVVKKAYENNELNDIDYAIIAYGHNDHYFQPPIENEEEKEFDINDFTSAYSFKGSYRFMINVLRKANPNIKIIIMNCTYSEYVYNGGPYGNEYTYEDYRLAQYEIAKEMDVKIVDPWNYTKTIFDGTTRNINYKDVVHLTVKGHQKLGTYLKKF